MRKLAMIIDFNNIAMRALFTCLYMGDGSVKNFDSDSECEVLGRKITTDLSNVIRTFSPDRVILACDSKDPWRNTVYQNIDGTGYKGNREHDENKNWDNIFKSFDELKEIFRLRGMIVTEISNTEADDIAVLWRDSLMADGFNVVMVSSDKDWSQLVSFGIDENSAKKFCVSYNPIAVKQVRKIYVSKEFNDWYESNEVVDIFFSNYDESKTKIKDAIQSNPKITLDVIDPDKILLDKVMCGDDGDNIPTFYEYYKNGKKVRVTALKASHIYESLNVSRVDDLKEACDNGKLQEALQKELKCEIDLDFPNRLNRQRTLVELNPDLFPSFIKEKFEKHRQEHSADGYVLASRMRMEDILKDSKYLKKGYDKPRENSIFDDISKLGKFSKTPNLF